MQGHEHRRTQAEIGRALADPTLRSTLRRAMATLYERRASAFPPGFDVEGHRSRARAIKEQALARNPELLAELEERISAAGGRFFFARTGEDARRYIAGVDVVGEGILRRLDERLVHRHEDVQIPVTHEAVAHGPGHLRVHLRDDQAGVGCR